MKKKKPIDHCKAAAWAHTDLNVFYGIVALLEGGLVSSDSYPGADRIITICKRESAKCLARYDRALARLPSQGRGGEA